MNELVIILKALSDETRFNMVNLLLKHDFCVGALARQSGVSKAAVSQHLQILRYSWSCKGRKKRLLHSLLCKQGASKRYC